jgi:hypothetical protein
MSSRAAFYNLEVGSMPNLCGWGSVKADWFETHCMI